MKKIILIIRDGWGEGKNYPGNAPQHANIPNHKYFDQHYPWTILKCTGNDVGNPKGAQGGSEVGHLTIGAGRIIWQPYELINSEIKNKSFFKNKALLSAIKHCKEKKANLHVSGLFSDQGIHADLRHLFALLDMAKKEKLSEVFIHLSLDGRDVPERSALGFVTQLRKKIKQVKIGTVASVFGRYFGMDRDKNWERTLKAYEVMVEGKGHKAKTAEEAIKMAYARGDKTDYYIEPTVIVDNQDKPIATINDGDAFIWFNFRTDRSRQITAMINQIPYCPVKPKKILKDLHYVCFTSYDDEWKLPVAFQQQKVNNNLGQLIAKQGMKQLRIAETEKYAHVTFFFNSQVEAPNKGEDRLLVPSPKVPSYDLQPEMSAYGITEKLLAQIETGKYDVIIVNYANPDLVGHSGFFSAAVKACEVVDECIGKVVQAAFRKNYVILLTSDHGNCEKMIDKNGQVDPSHGTNPVKLYLISNDPSLQKAKLKKGKGLKDIAPTMLSLLNIPKPKEMDGQSLIV